MIKMNFQRLKAFTTNFIEEYLYNKRKKAEFLTCILLDILLALTQAFSGLNDDWRGMIAQVQIFITIWQAFRFSYVGMALGVLSKLRDITMVMSKYPLSHDLIILVAASGFLFSAVAALIIGISSVKLEKQRKELKRLAVTDELTNAYNQRFFHTTLEDDLKNEKSGCIGLLLADIDNFRMYNDLYTHDYGDTVLKNTAAILKHGLNKNDIVCRFGGDEFAIILRGKDIQELEQKVQQIHEGYERLKKDFYQDVMSKKITLSMGLSVYPDMAKNKDELISQADMALYHAKNLGDDKVNLYQDIMLQIKKNISADHQQLIGIFRGLLSTITAKDKYTVGHCERVASYATMISEALGLDSNAVSAIQYAGLLHDIGKIELPKSLLNKIEKLTDEEYALIRKHPVFSVNILEPLSEMKDLIDYVLHHHERYDGRGYPDGLSGEQISLGARILCVADSFDAMVSERPYKKRMSIEEAFAEVERCAGSQFDSEIAKLFIDIMKSRISLKYNYKVEVATTSSKVNHL